GHRHAIRLITICPEAARYAEAGSPRYCAPSGRNPFWFVVRSLGRCPRLELFSPFGATGFVPTPRSVPSRQWYVLERELQRDGLHLARRLVHQAVIARLPGRVDEEVLEAE